jgi:thiol-disulfide isomerase/thioredoxin
MRNLLTGLVLILATTAQAQLAPEQKPPYLQNPIVPDFKVLLPDSTHWFGKIDLKKGRAVMFMAFNPDCEHCQKQADIIVANLNGPLEKIEIVMTTYQDMKKMREFIQDHKLAGHGNIHVGRDVNYFFGPFFNMHYSPFLAFYDKQGNLAKVYEGGAQAEKLKTTVEGL